MAASRARKPDTEIEGRTRVVIEGVEPEIDAGAFRARAVAGDPFRVEADVFADGHDVLRCVLLHRTERQRKWRETEMELDVNDRWAGSFVPDEPGVVVYTLEAWVDRFGTWLRDFRTRVEAGQDVAVDLLIGADRIDEVVESVSGADEEALEEAAWELREASEALEDGEEVELEALLEELEDRVAPMVRTHDPRRFAARYPRVLDAKVDRERAAFSAWYEFFPRSTGPEGEHGTFETAREVLPYVAEMGFDVIYLPPIHPIGTTFRKGRNNRRVGEPGDVGSPWAIGSPEGGHTAIHPDLGTLEDFHDFRSRAEELGMEVALDVAFQASPDHPWVEEHPEWFTRRPDGSIQYAENPPKKYEDIYPIDFQSDDWRNLWAELRGVFEYWIEQGVRVFRVDNPHTKSLRFWAWCIPEIQKRHPGTIFLSEAFTRPKVMRRLAKAGFTQSYTYFAWRTEGWELRQYLEELTGTDARHYFRPNFWPNTPDILTETLQHGGRPAFMMRLVLAATMTANYGIYGPTFELQEHVPREPGSEEYLDSEKYQLRTWDLDRPDSLADFIARVNRIRREHPALQRNHRVRFHDTDNEMLLAWSKRSADGDDTILVVVNLDPRHRQAGWVELDLEALGLEVDAPFQVHDLLGDGRYGWQGSHNYVELDPHLSPAHVFHVRPVGSGAPARG